MFRGKEVNDTKGPQIGSPTATGELNRLDGDYIFRVALNFLNINKHVIFYHARCRKQIEDRVSFVPTVNLEFLSK
jgi:hypothetical protein